MTKSASNIVYNNPTSPTHLHAKEAKLLNAKFSLKTIVYCMCYSTEGTLSGITSVTPVEKYFDCNFAYRFWRNIIMSPD